MGGRSLYSATVGDSWLEYLKQWGSSLLHAEWVIPWRGDSGAKFAFSVDRIPASLLFHTSVWACPPEPHGSCCPFPGQLFRIPPENHALFSCRALPYQTAWTCSAWWELPGLALPSLGDGGIGGWGLTSRCGSV